MTSPLSLLPGSPVGLSGGPLVDQILGAMKPQAGSLPAPASGTVSAEPVAAPPESPITGPGSTARRYGGPGGDIWGSILQALDATPSGMRLPYGILDPKKRGDFFTGLGERTLAKGPKGGGNA